VGWALLIPGIISAIIRFYFGLKYFTLIENNYSEEITGLLLFLGLFFIAFSKEKIENDKISSIRLRALILSFFINSFMIIISLLFVFGLGFVQFMLINLYSLIVVYIIVFRFYLFKYRDVIYDTKTG
jgi:hypothetical protein